MVKNKVGGNKAKKFARKNVNASQHKKKLRFVQDEDEKYGIVRRNIGNGQVLVLCQDGTERLCFIRNKFSGRNKQSNLVAMGSWVIVGCRSWETPKPGKLEKCDLLEIYDEQEKHILLQECSVNFTILSQEEYKLNNMNEHQIENTNVVFGNTDQCDELDVGLSDSNSDKLPPISKVDDIDFDDI